MKRDSYWLDKIFILAIKYSFQGPLAKEVEIYKKLFPQL